MPYTIGLLEGFMGARDASIKQQQDQDAATREQESNIYKYLLGSHDPEMRALAMSGMLESARPGKKGKGLSGYLGEVQGGQIYPQVLSRMNEMVPDEPPAEPSGPTPAARPGSAAMSTNQMTRPGSQPPQMPGIPLPPESPPVAQPRVSDTSSGIGAAPPSLDMIPPRPASLQGIEQGMIGGPPPPPPEHPMHRRGTGVATAEEIDAAASRRKQVEMQAQVTAEHQARMAEIDETARVRELPIPPNDEDMQLPDGTIVPTRMTARGLVDARTLQPLPPGAHPAPTGQASLDLPIPPNELALLVDPRTGANPPYGTTKRQADAMGLKIRTPDQRIRLAAIKEFIPMLKRAEILLPQVFPQSGPSSGLAGRVNSSISLAKQSLQGVEARRQLEGLLNVMKGPTAKIIAAESGRLTQQDIERASSMYPQTGMFADNPQVAQAMLQQFRGVVDDALQGMGEATTNWDGTPAPDPRSPSAGNPAPHVGEARQMSDGSWVVIRALYPDGTADVDPIKRLPTTPMVPALRKPTLPSPPISGPPSLGARP